MSRSRQRYYLNYFEIMDPPSREALSAIYHLAHDASQSIGQHVLCAMHYSVKNPALFRLTIQNVSLRLALKYAYQRSQTHKVAQLTQALEDFHIALDAFMLGLSLPEVELMRQARPYVPSSVRQRSTPFAMDTLVQYKYLMRPFLHRLKQALQHQAA